MNRGLLSGGVGLAVLALCLFAGSPRSADAAETKGKLVLDESCYWSHYIEFGLDRIDAKLLKSEGAKVIGARELKRLEKGVKRYFKPPYAKNGDVKDWTKEDWRDNALVWFFNTQGGSGGLAEFYGYSPPPPANWMAVDFDESNWPRQRLPLMVGNVLREMSDWGDHDMQQLQVRKACFRSSFEVPAAAVDTEYTLSMSYRGGARIFLNGKEIARGHLPQGELAENTPGASYPLPAYVRLPEEAPKDARERRKMKSRKYDFCADLMGKFEDACAVPKGEKEKFYESRMKFGVFRITRKGWDRVTTLRNRGIERIVLPKNLLREGPNVLAVEVRASHLHPVVAVDNWGRRFFLHAEYTWSHCRLLGLELRASSPSVPSGLTRPEATQVWVEDMHRRCYANDFGSRGTASRPLRFVGTVNGTFCAQLGFGTSRDLKGVKITPSELKTEDGKSVLPASALSVAHLVPHPLTTLVKLGRIRCYPYQLTDPISSASIMTLFQHGSAEARRRRLPREQMLEEMKNFLYYDHIRSGAPATIPGGRCQPVWFYLAIPEGAQAGTYKGTVTVQADGMEPVKVPVVAEVSGWRMPDPCDFQTIAAVDQSPYGVALQYGVDLWSDAHFKHMECSFSQLARIGIDWLFVPVIHDTEFGNKQDGMIRWTRKADGRLTFDFSIMDRYLELAQRYIGVPRVISFVVVHGTGRGGGTPQGRVTVHNEATGKNEILDVSSESPTVRDTWKTFSMALLQHMKNKGLEKSMYWGFGWDTFEDRRLISLLRDFTPTVYWTQTTHGGGGGDHVRAYSTVLAGQLPPGSKMGWQKGVIHLVNPRSGNNIISSNGNSPPFTFRMMADRAIVSGMNGIGRLGADYWKDAYFLGCRNLKTGGAAGMPCVKLFWPGKEGAESSARYEALREGIQETEARIFLEQALTNRAVPKDLVSRVKKVLFEHNRETLYISAGRVGTQINEYCAGWQDRSRRLFSAAAAVAEAVGFDLNRQKINSKVAARGKTRLSLRLRNWSAKPRAWKAVGDQPWIKLEKAEGSVLGQATLDVTLDAGTLKPLQTASGKITITDVVSGKKHSVAVTARVSKVFELVLPKALNYLGGKKPDSERSATFNVEVGGAETREFAFYNHSGEPFAWTIDSPVEWLEIQPKSGQTPAGQNVLIKVTARPPDREGITHVSTLTVKEVDGKLTQDARIITHVIVPYTGPAALPKGEAIYLGRLMVTSHKGRLGDPGGPLSAEKQGYRIHGRLPSIPPNALIARPRQETVYKLEGRNFTAFSTEVEVHPVHVQDGKKGLDKLLVNFEVHVDGSTKAQSGLMKAGDKPRRLVVDGLTGVKELKLVTRFDVPEGKNSPGTWYTFPFYSLWREPKLYGSTESFAQVPVLSPFQKKWHVIGPFTGKGKEHPPEKELKLDAKYKDANGELAWQSFESKGSIGTLWKLPGHKKKARDITCYALVYAHCTEPVEAQLETWYWSGIKIWVNGEIALESKRTTLRDVLFERAAIRFKKGANPILIKVGKQAWNWTLQFRIAAKPDQLKKITFMP